jgi:hypothetical protein
MNRKLFLIICILNSFNSKNNYDYLLEWGKNNSLFISDKLSMKYISENNKSYYTNDDIPENTLIMNIPFKIMLTVKNALDLLNSKKLNKLYVEYKKDDFKINIDFLPFSRDQSFLSYVIYLVNYHKKRYKKNKFYKYFHYFFDNFESNIDSFPVSYNEYQLRIIQGSVALRESTLMKNLFKEEVHKLEHEHNQNSIDFDEYLRLRSLIIAKSLNISNMTCIIPFIDMFVRDPIDFNVDYKLNETNNNLYIYTTKQVRKGDILYIKSRYISNIKRFILYGETVEKMKDYIESFRIPLISPMTHHSISGRDKGYYLDDIIELVDNKFYENALEAYKEISKLKKQDGSDLSAYKLFLKNLELVRGTYDHITNKYITEQFINSKDIENVKRVLYLEKKFLDEKIRFLRNFIDKFEQKINGDL